MKRLFFWSVFALYFWVYSLTWGGVIPRNYEVNPGVLQDGFESVGSWTVAQSCGSTFTLNSDPEFIKSGSGSARYTMPSGNCGVTATRVVNQVFNHALFGFWFYVSPPPNNNLSSVTVSFCQNSGCTIIFSRTLNSTNTRFYPGWNWVVLHRDDFTNTGGNDWAVAQDRMRVAVSTNSSGAGVFYIDDYYMGFYNRPKVILRFDDGSSTQQQAIVDATDRGIKLSLCIIGVNVGTANHHTLSEIQEHQSWGHEICNHTWSHQTVGALGDEAFVADAVQMARFMEANGLGKSARIIAYPQSQSVTGYSLLVQNNFVFAAGDSTLQIQPYHKGIANPYRIYLKTIGDPSVALVDAQNMVFDAIKRGGVLIGLFHNFTGTDPPVGTSNWSFTRAVQFYDWLNTMKEQVDVVTFSEFIGGLENSRRIR